MHTLGFRFKPWTEAKAIADGPSILSYVRRTAEEEGIEKQIRFGHRVVSARWSTPDSHWTVEAERTDTGETVNFTLRLPGGVQRLLPLRPGLLAGFPRAASASGAR